MIERLMHTGLWYAVLGGIGGWFVGKILELYADMRTISVRKPREEREYGGN